MSSIWRLIYTSRRNCVAADLGAAHLAQIQAAAAHNNARDRLVGVLIASQRRFAQVLEGPRESIERTFERITCDSRHDDILVISFAPTEARLFTDFQLATEEFDESRFGDERSACDAMLAQLRASMERLELTGAN